MRFSIPVNEPHDLEELASMLIDSVSYEKAEKKNRGMNDFTSVKSNVSCHFCSRLSTVRKISYFGYDLCASQTLVQINTLGSKIRD